MSTTAPSREADRRSRRWARRAATAAIVAAVAFLAAPALSGVPAHLVKGCGVWIVSAGVLELLSAVGFVVFFKLVFAAPAGWRHAVPAALRALGASTILPAGGLIGPTVGAWSASTERPDLTALTRATVTFVILTTAPAVLAIVIVATALWLGLPDGPHTLALTLLPAVIAAAVLAATLLAAHSTRRQSASPPSGLRRVLTELAITLKAGIADAHALVEAGNWKLTGAIAYTAFDGAVLWASFHAYGRTPPIAVIAMGYLIGSLAGAVPLPAGLGAVDGGLIGALALYGAPIAPAAAAVLLYRGISLVLPATLGALGWICSPAERVIRVGARSRRFGIARAKGGPAHELVAASAES